MMLFHSDCRALCVFEISINNGDRHHHKCDQIHRLQTAVVVVAVVAAAAAAAAQLYHDVAVLASLV